uniref:Uncharacterized protein n=1 Tax=Plectus sambesii TaxID=2011161 RepID=A0A914W1T4_9BILA
MGVGPLGPSRTQSVVGAGASDQFLSWLRDERRHCVAIAVLRTKDPPSTSVRWPTIRPRRRQRLRAEATHRSDGLRIQSNRLFDQTLMSGWCGHRPVTNETRYDGQAAAAARRWGREKGG